MTQSHLPRTGRGVIEAVIMALQICNLESCLPFRKKMQAFFISYHHHRRQENWFNCLEGHNSDKGGNSLCHFQPHDWHGRACETQPPSGKDIL